MPASSLVFSLISLLTSLASLPRSFRYLTCSARVAGNSIGLEGGMARLCEGVVKSESLASLDLRNNKITGRSAAQLAKAFGSTRAPLVRVDCRWNGSIGRSGGQALLAALETCTTLTDLPLNGCAVPPAELEAISVLLARNKAELHKVELPSQRSHGGESKVGGGGNNMSVGSIANESAARSSEQKGSGGDEGEGGGGTTHNASMVQYTKSDMSTGAGAHRSAPASRREMEDQISAATLDSDACRAQLRVLQETVADVQTRLKCETSAHAATQLRLQEAHETHSAEREDGAKLAETLRTDATRAREAKAVAEEARQNARTHSMARELRDERVLAERAERIAELERDAAEALQEQQRLQADVLHAQEKLTSTERRLEEERAARHEGESRHVTALAKLRQRHASEIEDTRKDTQARLAQGSNKETAQDASMARLDEELRAAREESLRYRLEAQECMEKSEEAARQRSNEDQQEALKSISERLDQVGKARADLETRSKLQSERHAEAQARQTTRLEELESWLTDERANTAELRGELQQAKSELEQRATEANHYKKRLAARDDEGGDFQASLQQMRRDHETSLNGFETERVKEIKTHRERNQEMAIEVAQLEAQLRNSEAARASQAQQQATKMADLQMHIVQSVRSCFRDDVSGGEGSGIGSDGGGATAAASVAPTMLQPGAKLGGARDSLRLAKRGGGASQGGAGRAPSLFGREHKQEGAVPGGEVPAARATDSHHASARQDDRQDGRVENEDDDDEVFSGEDLEVPPQGDSGSDNDSF